MAKIKAYDLINAIEVGDEDVLLIETDDGTKIIKANDLLNPYTRTELDSILGSISTSLAGKQSVEKILVRNIDTATDVHKIYEVYEQNETGTPFYNCLGKVIFCCQDANSATSEEPVDAIQIWFTTETDTGCVPIKYRHAIVVDGDSADAPVIGSWDSSWTMIENPNEKANVKIITKNTAPAAQDPVRDYVDDAIDNDALYLITDKRIFQVEGHMLFCGNKDRFTADSGQRVSQWFFLRSGMLKVRTGLGYKINGVNSVVWDQTYNNAIVLESTENKATLAANPQGIPDSDSAYPTCALVRKAISDVSNKISDILTYDQRNQNVIEFLDAYADYTDYPSTSSDVDETAQYMRSYLDDTARYSDAAAADNEAYSRPRGITVSIPSNGILVIKDGKYSMSYPVSAGEHTIYNITPGNVGAYYLLENSSVAQWQSDVVYSKGAKVNHNGKYWVSRADGNTQEPGGSSANYLWVEPANDNMIAYGEIHSLRPSSHPLRMIYCKVTRNVRDLGGWRCDGGTIRFGKLFRGAILFDDPATVGGSSHVDPAPEDVAFDKKVLHDMLGIRFELDLSANASESVGGSAIGPDVGYVGIDGTYYVLNAEKHLRMLKYAIRCAVNNTPVYIHCKEGADRTGTFIMLLEAILGVDLSDIDKDYELTSFQTGNPDKRDYSKAHTVYRRRNELASSSVNRGWRVLMFGYGPESSTEPHYGIWTDPNIVGDTLRDRVIDWVLKMSEQYPAHAITLDDINKFRAAMIDGTPELIV